MANIKIGATSYPIQDEWFKIALKYFQIDPENEVAINMLKAGLFGYNNEIQSNEIKNNVYHRNVLYDEHFLNTASFPESIANFAKLTNVDAALATPAKMRATLAIRRDDIINSPLKKQIQSVDTTLEGFARKVYILTISKDYVFSIEQIPFRLPYDLQFVIKENEVTGKYSISVKYDTEGDEFPFLKVTSNPYLKTWNENTEDGDYIFIGIDLYQLYKNSKTFSITSNNYLDNLFLTTSFSGQIAYLEVYYIYNGTRTKIKTYQNNQYTDSHNIASCYYAIMGQNLELSFGADSNSFRPRKNSEVEIVMYTTYGEAGNFTYTGDIDVNFSSSNDFSNMGVKVTPITNSSGGKNKYTTTELKNKITEAMITRKNVITDTDLNYYFTNFNTNTSINGSNVEFFKKRNDILKRVFTGYITMRERSGKVIPTNTAPHLLISKNYLSEPVKLADNDDRFNNILKEHAKGIIRDNSKVLYDRMNDKFMLFENNIISVDTENKFIIDKTDQNLDFVYDIVRKTYIYYERELNILKETQYKLTDDATRINRKIFLHNETTKETLLDRDDFILNSPIIKCANNEYMIHIKDLNLNLSMNDNDTSDENAIICKATEYDFICNSDKYLSDKRFIVYAIPYTLKIIDDPVYKCNYYITSVYALHKLQLTYVNNFVDRNFTFNNIQIDKKPNVDINSEIYNISVDLNTNLTTEYFDEGPNGEAPKCLVRMIIYDKNKEIQGCLEMERINDSFTFEADIITYKDIINKNEKIMTIGSLYDLGNPKNLAGGATGTIFLTDKINIEIAVLYKDGIDVTKYGNFDYMSDMNEYATACVYSNAEEIPLFRNLENYVYSDILPVKLRNDNGDVISEYYDLKQVPLVEYGYFQQKYDEILDILDAYDDVSYELINTLENNNSLDLKFTNTYGHSRYWVTDTNNLEFKYENFDYVDVTSIPLNFTIYTNRTIDNTEDNIIKEFISDFVEASNHNGLFAISNLLRELENTFDSIQYVEFGKVAGEDTQKIFNAFEGFNNMTTSEINDYVPEYLNIEKILKYDDTYDDGINVYLKYDYNINVVYK